MRDPRNRGGSRTGQYRLLKGSGIFLSYLGIGNFLALTFCVAHGMMEFWKDGIMGSRKRVDRYYATAAS